MGKDPLLGTSLALMRLGNQSLDLFGMGFAEESILLAHTRLALAHGLAASLSYSALDVRGSSIEPLAACNAVEIRALFFRHGGIRKSGETENNHSTIAKYYAR